MSVIVDNDFHETQGLFDLLKGLEVEDMDKTPTIPSSLTNGNHAPASVNGDGISHNTN